MRSVRWCVLALGLVLSACEENEAAVADPEPLAPVEVTADEDGEATEGVEALRARVVELEQELARCRGDTAPATAPQMAAIPEGVDVPAAAPTAEPSDPIAPGTPSSTRRRTDRDPDPVGLPNPMDVLFGD